MYVIKRADGCRAECRTYLHVSQRQQLLQSLTDRHNLALVVTDAVAVFCYRMLTCQGTPPQSVFSRSINLLLIAQFCSAFYVIGTHHQPRSYLGFLPLIWPSSKSERAIITRSLKHNHKQPAAAATRV